jgi:molybdopterin-containing oxidoreductase family iron-sulfur binding subunit
MSKRSPYEFAEDRSGRKLWRSLAELEQKPELLAQLPAEFPPNITEPPDGMSRRSFFNLMGASAALAGLAACRSPDEKIVPFSKAPEETIPGVPMYYATAAAFGGTAYGLVVESHDGRPTKIEGNATHPESVGGGLLAWLQASVLDLYDPDRAEWPTQKNGDKRDKRSHGETGDALKALGAKLKGAQGARFAVLTGAHRSPTLQAQLDALKAAYPQTRFLRWDPTSRDAQREGARLAFGKPFETVLDIGKAKVIVTLDADILHSDGSVVQQAEGFSRGRSLTDPAAMNRLYAVESTFSVTGGTADHRLRLKSRDVSAFAFALAAEIGAAGVAVNEIGAAGGARAGQLSDKAKEWARSVAKDLVAQKGAGVIVAGPKQPAVVHAIAHALNAALGNVGQAVKYVKPFDEAGEGVAALAALATSLGDGSIDTLLVLDANPAFNAPANLAFAEALKAAVEKNATVVVVSSHVDETAALATWHLNRAHDLESWSDVVSEDGTAAIVQPLIAPLFNGYTDAEVVSLLLGKGERAYDLVRATWMPRLALGGEKAWRKALHEGVIANVEGFPFAAENVAVNAGAVASAARALAPAASGMEVTFAPDPHAWDGRFANNAWLQEWPDPMNKHTWGNVALVSPATAKRLGIVDGNTISISIGDGVSGQVPAIVSPGQADDSIALSFGQGRAHAGRVARDVGHDVYRLRAADSLGYAGDVKVTGLGGNANLAHTQENFSLEGRPHVRVGSLEEYKQKPGAASARGPKGSELFNLWNTQKTDIHHKWGLAIDLNTCTGCGACQVACQAENNIPVVGADGVRRSREMNWLRVDRYYEGDPDDPRSVMQPLPCQQCENAPCEQVCPVAATTHSPEGLNDMAYNRCVGTRYCANNCPFKVRKFNFFNYTDSDGAEGKYQHNKLRALQYNPDVTVRSRGVMEKCTFCTQRIQEAKIAFKREGQDHIPDGTIRTACQQACPVGAIVFGDLSDKDAQVSKLHADPRSYKLLEELNVRPRVAYLAKIRNLNPELEKA